MKKAVSFLAALFLAACCFAQATGRILNLKDAWGTEYNYIGEIKNNLPNGFGMAIYEFKEALRYVGNFNNGKFHGKGTLLYRDFGFMTGEWKNGKLTGIGTELDENGNIYRGEFLDGARNGFGILVRKDNGIVAAYRINDVLNGRCIYIPAEANMIQDNIYRNNKREGTGYQYDLPTKKLFEGEWKDDKWVKACPATYRSFLKEECFEAKEFKDVIVIGCSNGLFDTVFTQDKVSRERTFGMTGRDGVLVRDDKGCFFGKGTLNDIFFFGYRDYGADYSRHRQYGEGPFDGSHMSGNSVLINLFSGNIYHGNLKKGIISGKGVFATREQELIVSEFADGKPNGAGYRIDRFGNMLKGTWVAGIPATISSFTDEKGKAINLSPKTLNETVMLLKKQHERRFIPLRGASVEAEDEYDRVNPRGEFLYLYQSLLTVPGAQGKSYVVENLEGHPSHFSTVFKTNDWNKAKEKYMELCKQVQALTIPENGVATKLTGEVRILKDQQHQQISKFFFPGKFLESRDFAVCVVVTTNPKSSEPYEVILGFGAAGSLQKSFADSNY